MHSKKIKKYKYFTPIQITTIAISSIVLTLLVGTVISKVFNWKNENSSGKEQRENEDDYFQVSIDKDIASTAVILAYNEQLYYSLPNLIGNEECLGEKLGETCNWKAKKDRTGNTLVCNGMVQNTNSGNEIYCNKNTTNILFIKGGNNIVPLFNSSTYNKFKNQSLNKIIDTCDAYSVQFLYSDNDNSIKLGEKTTQDFLMGLLPIKQYYKIYGGNYTQGRAVLKISNDVEYICRWEYSKDVNSLVLFDLTDSYAENQSPKITYMCSTQSVIDNFE